LDRRKRALRRRKAVLLRKVRLAGANKVALRRRKKKKIKDVFFWLSFTF
jgi:hypothetical protein